MDDIAMALDFFDASINRIAAWVIGALPRMICATLQKRLISLTEAIFLINAKKAFATAKVFLFYIFLFPAR